MNVQLLFYLICKFCADSQNQEPSVDWGSWETQMGWSGHHSESPVASLDWRTQN